MRSVGCGEKGKVPEDVGVLSGRNPAQGMGRAAYNRRWQFYDLAVIFKPHKLVFIRPLFTK